MATLIGYGIFNGLLARNAPAHVVPWILLVPVVAMASAWLLLGQAPNAAEAGGGAILLLGTLIATVCRRTRVHPVPRSSPEARVPGKSAS